MTETIDSIAAYGEARFFTGFGDRSVAAEINLTVASTATLVLAGEPSPQPILLQSVGVLISTACLARRLGRAELDMRGLPGRFPTGSDPAAAIAVVTYSVSNMMICATTESSIQRRRKLDSFVGEIWTTFRGFLTLMGTTPQDLLDTCLPPMRDAAGAGISDVLASTVVAGNG